MKKIFIAILIIAISNQLFAQAPYGFPLNSWMGSDITIGAFQKRSWGIGGGTPAFGGFGGYDGDHPQARLHVSAYGLGNYTAFPINLGSLFRTDGLTTATNSWSMWTGLGPGLGSLEKFNLTVPASTNDLIIETNIPGSTMFFRNGPGIDVMQVNSVNGPGNGNVWIRKGVTHPFYTPAFLDIGGPIGFSAVSLPANENSLIYHNTSPQGPCPDPNRDGFRMLYDFNADGIGNADCLVIEKTDGQTNEPDGCIEFTNYGLDAIRRLSMTIDGNGHVGCGAGYTFNRVPWRRLNVAHATDPQFRIHTNHETVMDNEVYTDFHTTPIGDLRIDPRNTVNNLRTVYINYGNGTGLPANTFPGIGLDINGQENIRTVNQDDNLNQVLVWNPVDGNVRWRNASTITPGGSGTITNAQNGTNITVAPGIVELGGTLLHQTTIDHMGFILDLRNAGATHHIFYPEGASHQIVSTSPTSIAHQLSTTNVDYGMVLNYNNGIGVGTNQGVQMNVTGIGNIVDGVYGFVEGSTTVNGVRIVMNGTGTNKSGFSSTVQGGTNSYGIDISTINADNGYGVRTYVDNNTATPSTTLYGIHSTAPIGPNYWAGYFNGNVHVNGTLSAVTNGGISDQAFKTDIDTISNVQQIISQLTPRTFYFDTTNVYGINFPSTRQYGFVAQEVEPVLPELVSQIHKPEVLDSLGNVIYPSVDYKTLNYDAMIALLMKGMQEQQTVIENLTNQLNDLNAIVNNCCSQGNNLQAPNNGGTQTFNYQPNIHQTDVRLTDNYCVLGENSPNPFRDHTVINYELAETIQSAQIVFYNMVGQIIKVLEINDRGLGRLNVYGDDLRSGMYSYSLIVDGNVCETKKMIKE